MIRLDNATLFSWCRILQRYTSKNIRKLIERITSDREFAVWEIPYDEPETAKTLVKALHATFPPEVIRETLMFVNNGLHGRYKTYIAAGFEREHYPHVQAVLNTLIGVVQDFQVSPHMLIALACNGQWEMEPYVTENNIDSLYQKEVPSAAS